MLEVGDKVIINPKIVTGGVIGDLEIFSEMREPGVFTIKEINTATKHCLLSNSFIYPIDALLKVPLFKVGDKVKVKKPISEEMHFGVADEMKEYEDKIISIVSVAENDYRPTKIGEDGCLYRIEGDRGFYNWASTSFDKITSLIKPFKEDENQLQEKRITVSRGDKYTGSTICCRGCKAAITVGHLSNKKISGI